MKTNLHHTEKMRLGMLAPYAMTWRRGERPHLGFPQCSPLGEVGISQPVIARQRSRSHSCRHSFSTVFTSLEPFPRKHHGLGSLRRAGVEVAGSQRRRTNVGVTSLSHTREATPLDETRSEMPQQPASAQSFRKQGAGSRRTVHGLGFTALFAEKSAQSVDREFSKLLYCFNIPGTLVVNS